MKEYTTAIKYACGHILHIRTLDYRPERVSKAACPKCYRRHIDGEIELPYEMTMYNTIEYAKLFPRK
jgi:hypothetical protein